MAERYSNHYSFEHDLYQTKQVSMALKPKLSESSKAVMLLCKKFRNKEFLLTDNPKDVWVSDLIFIVHKVDNFRTKFNWLKAEELEMKDKN